MEDSLDFLQKFLGLATSREGATQEERIILETFEAIYGKVLWDLTDPDHQTKNSHGYNRVTRVLIEYYTDRNHGMRCQAEG